MFHIYSGANDVAIKKDCVPRGNVLVGDKAQTSKDRIFKEI